MILLDTHVLVWWLSGNKSALSMTAKHAINTELKIKNKVISSNQKILVSSISAWEISMLVTRNRLTLSMDVTSWLSAAEAVVEFIPVDNEIAIKSIELPGIFHKDPADRIIVATARKMAATLITADEKIHSYKNVKWIW